MSVAALGVAGTVALGVGVASVGAGLYEASQQQNISSQALGLAQNTQGEQMYYNQQLQQLMANPGSFLTNPVFQSSLDQGLSGVSRQMAAQGYLGSGNQATALEQYGQSQASSALLGQEQLLASMSGTQSASSPASSLATASGASSSAATQLGGTLASLGFMQNNSTSGGGGGIPSGTADYTDPSGYTYTFSDRRLKKNIRRIGQTSGGQPWYEFEYIFKSGTYQGVLADESPEDAVIFAADGYALVDYQRIR